MFGGGYGQEPHESIDGRPTKRPRNGAVVDHGPIPPMPMPDGAAQLMLPPPQHRLDIQVVPSSTASRGRQGEDRNNRKLSCKECRRLKLKCDRVFPCQSCVKRGCGSLCPEGALTSGRGSRFILANTEQLHEKIAQLSERVRQLEDALQGVQHQVSPHPHPLLSPELLRIKTSQELYGTAPSAQPAPPSHGTPYEPVAGTSRDDRLRDSVGSLALSQLGPPQPGTLAGQREHSTSPEVAPDILQLSSTFPFPWTVDLKIRKRIRDALPPVEEARTICEEARRNALWQYNLDSSETFIPNLIHCCYSTPIEDLSPRRLALLLMVLAIGSLVDLNRPLGSLHGEAYHHLARAAVCEIPLMEEPDFDVLHALFFMIWFHLIFSDNKKAIGYAWNLMGFVTKLAQGLGLHRESPRLKLIPEEHDKRRAIFWELVNMDCRMSLSLGRPPSICLAHIDVQQPSYVGAGIYVPKEEIMYHEWKQGFFLKCLSPILEAMVAKEQPDYSRIIELDRTVRDFATPTLLATDPALTLGITPRHLHMQRATLALSRELALLQLHRKYFTQAMSDSAAFDLHHQYSPSVSATHLAASGLINTVETLFNHEQQLSVRFLHFWFNSFSAAVTLSLIISRAPTSPLSHHALESLERVAQLFQRAAAILPFSSKTLPVLQKLLDKSRRTLQGQHLLSNNGSGARQLPACFKSVHPFISQNMERIMSSIPPSPSSVSASSTSSLNLILDRGGSLPEGSIPYGVQGPSTSSLRSLPPAESWLPDIYKFSSVGVGAEDRYGFFAQLGRPFMPSSPRIAETKDFNLDHGDIAVGLVDETSYMAWF